MTFRWPNGQHYSALLEKTMAGSTENQQKIVDRGCCFGRVDPVIQRVVDKFLLIWSHKNLKKLKKTKKQKNVKIKNLHLKK